MPYRARGWLIDAGIVVVLLALTLALGRPSVAPGPLKPKMEMVVGGESAWHSVMVIWWAATGLGATTLLLRARLPLVALLGTGAMSWVHAHGPIVSAQPIDLGAPIALYTVAAHFAKRRLSYAALAVALAAGLLLGELKGRPFGPWSGPLTPIILLAMAWFAGESTRNRRAYVAEVQQRARDLERERDQQAELATAAERSRITLELHDVVAHGLSVIVIQAQAAASALRSRPERAEQSLSAVLETGRTALGEMRRFLKLQQPDGGQPDLTPQPGIDDLPALVQQVRAAGLSLTADILGPKTRLPTDLDLSTYRIAQEALTNVLKHAGPTATASLIVHCGPKMIEVSVEDTGPGAPGGVDEHRGNGLRGMRERVAVLGGTLRVQTGRAGGFRVHAQLPRATP